MQSLMYTVLHGVVPSSKVSPFFYMYNHSITGRQALLLYLNGTELITERMQYYQNNK